MSRIFDNAGLDRWRRQQRLDPELLRRVRASLLRTFAGLARALAHLPAEVRTDFQQQFGARSLSLADRHDSEIDGATKLLLRTSAGLLLESVILRVASGRTSLCVSSQVGCAARCDFCATGRMDVVKNLAAEEILDQVLTAGEIIAAEGRRLRNIVFMGMGEPLHNEAELHRALDSLTDRASFNLHSSRLMVSTVGIPAAMVRLAATWPQVRIALSLHSVRPEVRALLMPISARHSLDELREAIREVTSLQQREIMIEYLLLENVNDTDDDVRLLVEYLRGIKTHVNLIPFNPIREAPHLVGSSLQRCRAFSAGLKAAGLPVTTRYSLGSDVAAACGQLVRSGQRRKVNA
jgi:23S rRNA (adenine2503-C2)-methyltransferase